MQWGTTGAARKSDSKDTSWNLLLGDFVEGEDSVAASRLRFLDPTGTVSNAVALHIVVEQYGCAAQIWIG